MVKSEDVDYWSRVTKYFCHSKPERCPNVLGRTLPLCFRCSGTVLGAFITLGIFQFLPNPFLGPQNCLIGIILGSFGFFDGFTQFLDFRESSNNIRFITGLLGGVGIYFISVYLETPFIRLIS